MDARHLFDTLRLQEPPPTTVDVGRARSAGRAMRRRRAGAAAAAALSVCAAVTVTSLGLSQPGQRDEVAVAVPPVPPATSASPAPEPSHARHRQMKKEHPPAGRIAYMPEMPIWLWLGRYDLDPDGVLLCNSGSAGAGCAGFPALTAKEFARIQGTYDLGNVLGEIFFGIARTEVHGLTAVTADGRRYPGSVERKAGAGLGVWAVRFPWKVRATLIFTGADGETLQRIRVDPPVKTPGPG